MKFISDVSLCLFLAAFPVLGAPGQKHESPASSRNDVVQKEYDSLVEMDEASFTAIEKIVKEADAFAAQGTPTPKAVLSAKIDQQLDPVRKAYEDFLKRHPKHVDALLAFGSFLNETGDQEGAIVWWEKAREVDPKNPAPWNNLANVFGHIGPVRKAFHYYEKAIELDPTEPIYLQNMATTTYLFRKDAMEMYRITEDQVFDKALDYYRQALKLDSNNFVLAHDLAQSYYGIKPLRRDDAINAWNDALKLAKDDEERDGVYLHLARIELMAGRFDDASKNLARVNHPEWQPLKTRLQRNLDRKKSGAKSDSEEDLPSPSQAKSPAGAENKPK